MTSVRNRMRAMAAISAVLMFGGLLPAGAVAQPAEQGGSEEAPKQNTWAQVAQWPDFTNVSWGEGDGPAMGLLAHDFSGLGIRPRAASTSGDPARPACMGLAFCTIDEMPLTPEFRKTLAKTKPRDTNYYNTTPWSCEPGGVVVESGQRFYYTPGVIILAGLSDYYNVWRRIYMDGRSHPEDLEPTYFGHSIGHWEGDVLVVDTVGISPEAKLAMGIRFGTDRTHLVERIRLIGPDKLEIRKTVTNPDVFTQPVDFVVVRERVADYEFPETFCFSDHEATYDEPEESEPEIES